MARKWRSNFAITYGPEAHLKGRIDGEFARLNAVVTLASKNEFIWTIADVVRVLQRQRVEVEAVNAASQTRYRFIDFMPPETREIAWAQCEWVKPRSLPCIMSACHHWHFQINDFRRQNFEGRGIYHGQITGVTCRAHILPEVHCTGERVVTGREGAALELDMAPVLRVAAAPEEAGEEEVVGDGDAPAGDGGGEDPMKTDWHYMKASEVPINFKIVQGWRCAYRQCAPEDATLAKVETI